MNSRRHLRRQRREMSRRRFDESRGRPKGSRNKKGRRERYYIPKKEWFGAIRSADKETIQKLIDEGINLAISDRRGTPSLIKAIPQNRIFRMLLRNGADTEVRDRNGNTPLIKAAQMGELKIVKLLIQKRGLKVDLDAQNDDGDTALHVAAEMGYAGIVKLLLDDAADPYIRNEDGDDALDVAEDKKIKAMLRKYR